MSDVLSNWCCSTMGKLLIRLLLLHRKRENDWLSISWMLSYPPTYINHRFKQFFVTYAASFMSPSSSILSTINDENHFSSMRALLLSRSTTSQSKCVKRMIGIDMKNNQVVEEVGEAPLLKMRLAANMEQRDRQVINRLLLHYTHEQRSNSYKRDIHQIW